MDRIGDGPILAIIHWPKNVIRKQSLKGSKVPLIILLNFFITKQYSFYTRRSYTCLVNFNWGGGYNNIRSSRNRNQLMKNMAFNDS